MIIKKNLRTIKLKKIINNNHFWTPEIDQRQAKNWGNVMNKFVSIN